MRGAGRVSLAMIALALVAAGCEWNHVRGDAALSGRASTITSITVANVNRVVPEWQSGGSVASPGESPTMSGPWIETQQGGYLLAPQGCAGSPTVCPPAWTRSGWTGPGTGEAPPTQSGNRSFVLPASSTEAGAATFAAYSADGTTACTGTPVVCSPLWSAAATGLVPDGHNVGGVAAPTVAGSTVLVTTGTGHVLAYDAAGEAGCAGDPVVCEPRWSASGVVSSAPVAVVDGTAFATGADDPGTGAVGGLYAFAADGTGEGCSGDPLVCAPRWRGELGDGTEVLAADEVSPAAVVEGTAYVVAGSTLHAFATDGTTNCTGDPVVCAPLWTTDIGSTSVTTRSAPAVVGGRVYVPRDGGLSVVSASTGAPLASLDAGAAVGSHASGAVVAGGVVWLGTADGLLAFDAACSTTCAPLLQQFAGQSVTTPAVNGDRVHALVDGTLQTLVLPPLPPPPPLELGNPRNYLGTGTLFSGAADSVSAREGKWLAVSGYCTRKVQGDRIAAKNAGTSSTNNCADTELNAEYDDTNYTIAIDLPPGRTRPVDIVVFDGNLVTTSTGGTISGSRTLDFAPGGLASGTSLMPTTFTLHQADATPDDDADNPTMLETAGCASDLGTGTDGSRTFPTRNNSPEDNYDVTIAGVTNAVGYWLLCRIPPTAPAGRYPLHVRNQASATGAPAPTAGSNNYGILALPNGGGPLPAPVGQQLCDTASDPTCPKVVAERYLGLTNTSAGGVAEPFLARVPASAAGKVLEIELWDPAEGALELRVLQPTGPASWGSATFSWSAAPEGGSVYAQGTDVTAINVAAYDLNNKLTTIRVPVPDDYAPPEGNESWRIRVSYGSTATDRTTWSARIIDAP